MATTPGIGLALNHRESPPFDRDRPERISSFQTVTDSRGELPMCWQTKKFMKLKHLVTGVTGASQGLGTAMAREFFGQGAHLAFCARDENLVHAVAAELKEHAHADQIIFAAACDVSVEEDVEAFFREVRSRLGSVNVLVNNAGVYGPNGEGENDDCGGR